MARIESKGTCLLCKKTFSKQSVSAHLKACREKHPAKGSRLKAAQTLHLVVEGTYLPEYWMHLEAAAEATLEDLDLLLRDTWLECCGHLSGFKIEGVYYNSGSMVDPWNDERTMDFPLGDILRPKLKFSYTYDFGSSTDLSLRVVSQRETIMKPGSIQIQARNDAPDIRCVECDKPATMVCTECSWSGEGWFCKRCLRKHECGDEMALPVVNSPRVGVCGYDGKSAHV